MKNPNKTKKHNLPAYHSRSREVWVYFVMQIELRMQIRQGPLGGREGRKMRTPTVPSFLEQGGHSLKLICKGV